jgi:nucleotide-binding universal stress UspA family protein
MYKKLLAPLDGSEYSECVLEHVKALASGCNVKDVVILYVIEPLNPGMYDVPERVVSESVTKGKEFGSKYLANLAAKLKDEGLIVETVLLNGQAAPAILDYTSQNGVDLIAMSTHGRSGFSRWMMGSVADKVSRHSPVPVLLVRPSEIKTELKKSG